MSSLWELQLPAQHFTLTEKGRSRGDTESWRLSPNWGFAALQGIPGMQEGASQACGAALPPPFSPIPCSFLPLPSQTCKRDRESTRDGFSSPRLVFPPGCLSPCTAPSPRTQSGIAGDPDPWSSPPLLQNGEHLAGTCCPGLLQSPGLGGLSRLLFGMCSPCSLAVLVGTPLKRVVPASLLLSLLGKRFLQWKGLGALLDI